MTGKKRGPRERLAHYPAMNCQHKVRHLGEALVKKENSSFNGVVQFSFVVRKESIINLLRGKM